MEHCVFCAVLSPGTNKHNCGRPCDTHQVRLRDRVGMEHTLTADVGCRNTLFNAVPQSAAEAVPQLLSRGVRHFRVELLDETGERRNRTHDRSLSAAAGRRFERQGRVAGLAGGQSRRRDPRHVGRTPQPAGDPMMTARTRSGNPPNARWSLAPAIAKRPPSWRCWRSRWVFGCKRWPIFPRRWRSTNPVRRSPRTRLSRPRGRRRTWASWVLGDDSGLAVDALRRRGRESFRPVMPARRPPTPTIAASCSRRWPAFRRPSARPTSSVIWRWPIRAERFAPRAPPAARGGFAKRKRHGRIRLRPVVRDRRIPSHVRRAVTRGQGRAQPPRLRHVRHSAGYSSLAGDRENGTRDEPTIRHDRQNVLRPGEHLGRGAASRWRARRLRTGRRMCSFRGDLATLYRANIQCRTAVRILKPIHRFTAADEKALYEGIGDVDWLALLDSEGSLAIDPVVHSPVFTNSLYAAQLTKDAMVDQIRAATGRRPSVDLADPDLRVNLHIDREQVTVYLDSSGDSLHKRGYRVAAGEAPMNEVLAAGILRLGGWDQDSPLADFMCGSGTLVIEAALAARHIAPGLVRGQFAFQRWKDFCSATYDAEIAQAKRRSCRTCRFRSAAPISTPRRSTRPGKTPAGLASQAISSGWSRTSKSVAPPAAAGTLVVNPPYDERMKAASIEAVYRRLGDVLKRNWAGYRRWSSPAISRRPSILACALASRPGCSTEPIECRLLAFELFASEVEPAEALAAADRAGPGASLRQSAAADGQALASLVSPAGCLGLSRLRPRRARRSAGDRLVRRPCADHRVRASAQPHRDRTSRLARPHGGDRRRDAGRARPTALSCDRGWPRQPAQKVRRKKPAWSRSHEGPLKFETHLNANGETGLVLDRRTVRGMLWSRCAGAAISEPVCQKRRGHGGRGGGGRGFELERRSRRPRWPIGRSGICGSTASRPPSTAWSAWTRWSLPASSIRQPGRNSTWPTSNRRPSTASGAKACGTCRTATWICSIACWHACPWAE